jgi:hypothetical protein
LVLIGPAVLNPVYNYGATTLVKVLLDFNAQTGRVAAALPLTNNVVASRVAGLEYTVERTGGQIVLRGDFAAVVDMAGATNRAPGGATEVVLDAATGEVVAVR